jgi:hypothetical protein
MRQHLVPVSHLNGFVDPDLPQGQVWTWTSDSTTWQHKHPKAIAWKPDYYAVSGEDGEVSMLAEGMLSDIEDLMAKVLRGKLSRQERMDQTERSCVSLFVAMMHLRVPANHRCISDSYSRIATKMLTMMHQEYSKRPDSLEAKKEDCRRKTGKCDWAQLSPDDLDPSHFSEIRPTHESVIRRSFGPMFEFADVVLHMGWTFYVSKPPDFFITSDNPVHIVDTSGTHPLHGRGLLSKDTNVTLPITRNMALVAGWRSQGEHYAQASTSVVEEINIRSARCATRLLVSPKPVFPGSERLRCRRPQESPDDQP